MTNCREREGVPVRLTDELIAEMVRREGAGRLELVDAALPDLQLRIGEGGAAWTMRARAPDGSRPRIPIGAWPAVGAHEARSYAAALKSSLEQSTAREDPTLTVQALLDKYETRRLSQLRKGLVMGRALRTALGALGHRAIAEVTRRDIAEAVDEISDRAPIQANRSLAYIKAFFAWCVGRGYLDANPAAAISKPTRERTRDRTPSLEELADIWAAAGKLGYPFGPVVRLLILTAARRDEVGGLLIEELELPPGSDEALWTIPASRSKNGRAIRVPLAPLARTVVVEALASRSADGPFLFSTNGESAVSGWSKAKARLDREIDALRAARGERAMEQWRFHDLRRSFATYACDVLQVDPAVADRCLNHVGASTTSTVSRIYGRNEMFEQRRDALARWAVLFGGTFAAAQS